ncbi:hypothetical protein BpHYR1_026520 [Brachionus plicatilis]|uniref:Uncharacterized protein n=1 Tax=Brachionus plicatilis TaxID=10195 RepID=A0A3M7QU34_BRAPC|nr:hypothetical protein BpHYR1_026520 [Brachionus plicatilis]
MTHMLREALDQLRLIKIRSLKMLKNPALILFIESTSTFKLYLDGTLNIYNHTDFHVSKKLVYFKKIATKRDWNISQFMDLNDSFDSDSNTS